MEKGRAGQEERKFVDQSESVASENHAREKNALVLIRRRDKMKMKEGDCREWKRGEQVGRSRSSSNNQERGVWKPRGVTWEDAAVPCNTMSERTNERGEGWKE
jgi:hypothetical protein